MYLRLHLSDSAFQELIGLLGGSPFHAKRWLSEAEYRCNAELVEALEEQAIVSKANFASEHRPQDGIGQCVVRMSRKLHHWLQRWECMASLDARAFMAHLKKDPSMCLQPKVQQRVMVIKTRLLTQRSAVPSASPQGLATANGKEAV